ncbi:alpha,alpha-trehalose-phosphate synthase (UDP-forming) [Sabulicella glaciei]|uniref:Trehalose-6-phosphate synthase n=1 Tax=Sabulicella glaciei TaxID=2984948 RepID=A0ABT3NTY6_9PROT|nr:trehalose-6-phosphate synthase [Roseococcus sp. MDT2-1-1]MCW8085627.1 trehalose-6-phosphate synthase [Roseococcus sp. MDT2-1-1]
MARLVIVSNRVPTLGRRAQAGGLAVALQSVASPGTLWFGWSGQTATKTATEPRIGEARGVSYATLDLSASDYGQFYVGFSNATLWPLFHFRTGLMRFSRDDYAGYLSVNRSFAEALMPLLRPDDLVWVHDYHLIPLGEELRRLGYKGRLGFFLHIPFVPPAVLQVLPPAAELVRMLCAYDLTGFHTSRFVQDFLASARDLAGAEVTENSVRLDGRETAVGAFPIGIDAAAFARTAVRALETGYIARVRESLQGRALIVSADRLDYSKGLPNRLEGFGRLLARFPQHHRKVSFLQIAARSREDVAEYQSLRRELDRMTGDLNGRFSHFDWVPLRYMTQMVQRPRLAGLFRMARIGLVTPLQDGMNLVAKEFVAAQDSEDPGVLVLSRFAGAAEQLRDALIVNPYDPDEIADAMHAALEMPLEERKRRHDSLREAVFQGTAAQFCASYLDAFEAVPLAA